MNPEFLAFSIIILLFSVIVHEVMHGLVALKFGDHTAERAGRLTLNPIPHIDPVGTILLPAIMIMTQSPIFLAWAKPVPVNPLHFSNIRTGELMVSAAGILSNFALAIISAVLFHILSVVGAPFIVLNLLHYGVIINLFLGFFNLFPIPPLDGSKMLLSQLPYNLARQFEKLEPYGFFILIALLWIPLGNTSIIHTVLGFLVSIGTTVLGV
jgi:Zn-dependent protease